MSNLVSVLFDKDSGSLKLGNSQGGSGPLPNSSMVLGYHHIQATVVNTWTVHHNFNTNKLIVAGVFDVNNKVIIPDEIEMIDTNNVIIRFGAPMSGTANLALFL